MTDIPLQTSNDDSSRDIADLLSDRSQALAEEIAATTQMNFMFGLSLLTAKMLIAANPEAGDAVDRMLGNVTEALKRRAEPEFAALAEYAAEAGADDDGKIRDVIEQSREDLEVYISDIEKQYRLELFENVEGDTGNTA